MTTRREHADTEEESQADEKHHDGEGQGRCLTHRSDLSVMVLTLVFAAFFSEIDEYKIDSNHGLAAVKTNKKKKRERKNEKKPPVNCFSR